MKGGSLLLIPPFPSSSSHSNPDLIKCYLDWQEILHPSSLFLVGNALITLAIPDGLSGFQVKCTSSELWVGLREVEDNQHLPCRKSDSWMSFFFKIKSCFFYFFRCIFFSVIMTRIIPGLQGLYCFCSSFLPPIWANILPPLRTHQIHQWKWIWP